MKVLVVLSAMLLSLTTYAASNGKGKEVPSNGAAQEVPSNGNAEEVPVEEASSNGICKWYKMSGDEIVATADYSTLGEPKIVTYPAATLAYIVAGGVCLAMTPFNLVGDLCAAMNDGKPCENSYDELMSNVD